MSKGLLYDLEYCIGCFACKIACQQENGFDVETTGIDVIEQIYTFPNGHVQIDNVPVPTKLCNLCEERISSGEDDKPACAKACMASIIYYGDEKELLEKSKELKRPVLWLHN